MFALVCEFSLPPPPAPPTLFPLFIGKWRRKAKSLYTSRFYYFTGGTFRNCKMYTGNPIRQRNENSNYVAYFYESGIVQKYLDGQKSFLAITDERIPSKYDFSSDIVRRKSFYHIPTVEQIIASGYLAIPKGDPINAIISDNKHTSWLGLDDVIGQIRNRYELYQKNMYDLELGKCAAINTLYTHEALHGPSDSRTEYSLGKRLDKLYSEQREERTNLWRDVSRLKLLLPENAQKYLSAYRKLSILEESKGDQQ